MSETSHLLLLVSEKKTNFSLVFWVVGGVKKERTEGSCDFTCSSKVTTGKTGQRRRQIVLQPLPVGPMLSVTPLSVVLKRAFFFLPLPHIWLTCSQCFLTSWAARGKRTSALCPNGWIWRWKRTDVLNPVELLRTFGQAMRFGVLALS